MKSVRRLKRQEARNIYQQQTHIETKTKTKKQNNFWQQAPTNRNRHAHRTQKLRNNKNASRHHILLFVYHSVFLLLHITPSGALIKSVLSIKGHDPRGAQTNVNKERASNWRL